MISWEILLLLLGKGFCDSTLLENSLVYSLVNLVIASPDVVCSDMKPSVTETLNNLMTLSYLFNTTLSRPFSNIADYGKLYAMATNYLVSLLISRVP